MRGHIRKRGNKWSVVVDVGRDPETGRRKQKWHSGFDTRRDANRALTEILSRLERGTYVEPSKETVAVYLSSWLDAQRARLRPSTLASYDGNVKAHIIPALGPVPLQRLTAGHLDVLYADLLQNGRTDGRGGLGPRTVRYVHVILKRALSDAVRKSRLVRNPADQADPPSASASKATALRTWTAAEVRMFLAHVHDDRLYAAWLMAATTGMRRGELLGLRWRDLDLEAGRAKIVQTLISQASGPAVSQPKTAKGRRSVALDPATVAALKAHRTRQNSERLALGPTYEGRDLVFCREDGSPVWPRSFSRGFDRLAEAAGLPRIRLHDLRHTHATLALEGGVHPLVVSERLGHSKVSITLDTYSHVTPALEEDAAAKVAALVTEPGR